MHEGNNFALVPRPPSEIEKAVPGAKRILSGMVEDTLALARPAQPEISADTRMIYSPLSDACWSSAEARTEAMLPVIAAFKDWREWDQSQVKQAVEQIAILTVKRIIAEMRCLPENIRKQCRNVFNTKTALEAAQAAWDLVAIEDCAQKKPGDAGAIREAKWATYEAAQNASWAAAEAGWGAKRAEAATSSAATAAANAARAAMAEKANPDDVLRVACQLWTEATKPRGKLLIVDDEEGVRESLRVIFEDEYDLFISEDGPIAIKLAQENDIDVVVTNIRMAGMSGIEVLEQLKVLKPDIEVIITTGFETTDTIRQALRLRAFDYISKPFEFETIRAAVTKAMLRRTREIGIAAARTKSSRDTEIDAKKMPFKRRGLLLIVDDEAGPRQSLCVIFKDEYNLLIAEDGPKAIKLAQENDIDVVVTDIRMAGMSGIEVLERLKILKPDIEVIVMTAFETTDTMKHALRLRAFDYINVPFDIATIRSVVSKAMQLRTLEAKLQQ